MVLLLFASDIAKTTIRSSGKEYEQARHKKDVRGGALNVVIPASSTMSRSPWVTNGTFSRLQEVGVHDYHSSRQYRVKGTVMVLCHVPSAAS